VCGIVGIVAFNQEEISDLQPLQRATESLTHRGPDDLNVFHHRNIGLGHTRLSIIDTSRNGAQPMSDPSGRYTLIFNGEIYNFKQIRSKLEQEGVTFSSDSDTEVLLHLLIRQGTKGLDELNGFFSFAFYDKENGSLLLARDRMGIKPLLYYQDDTQFIFASEMKALFCFDIQKKLDLSSLHQYLQLTYIPPAHSIFKSVHKLKPGCYLTVDANGVKEERYYKVPYQNLDSVHNGISYESKQEQLRDILDDSVRSRLYEDVPLGAFLSGGIDSSIIVALASRHHDHLNTFTIGFPDDKFYDESEHATAVARHFKTEHTVFNITNENLYDTLHSVLDHLDEPFADSSALPVYILCKHTGESVKVALSGDGGDELFAGYNKHRAEYILSHSGLRSNLVKYLLPIWKLIPKDRSSFLSNKFRQFQRFAEGSSLPDEERYWKWCSFTDEKVATAMLRSEQLSVQEMQQRKQQILDSYPEGQGINRVLYSDTQLVLPGDMLYKVDMMSMANSLEVRVPMLDHRVVEFAFGLPEHFKIDADQGKKILLDAFRDDLPETVYNRPKKALRSL